jgi:thiol-disulfide isomerase/thioredoxin
LDVFMLLLRSGTGLLLAGLMLAACDRHTPDQPQGAPTAAPAPVKTGAVDRSHKGEAAPTVAFQGPDGKPTTLAAFKGRPVLVNLWATWCAPCIAELPTLDALAKRGTRVVAVSQDTDAGKAAPFLQGKGVALTPYRDPQLAFSVAYAANLPTSVYYDAQGRELWRVTGGRDWTSAETATLLAER